MRESVLYFPHIEIQNPTWLKTALLLWDNVYRISPKSYTPRDTFEVSQAIDSDLVRSVNLEQPDLQAIAGDFIEFLEHLPFTPAGLEAGEVDQLHPEKVDSALYPLLEQYSQGQPKGGWISLPREIIRGYMFFLSREVAKRRNLERCTDDRYAFGIAGYFSESANFDEFLYNREAEGHFTSLMFNDLLPIDLSTVPMTKVIEVVNRTHDERDEFRKQLIKFADGLYHCESKDHAQTILNDYKNDLLAAKDQLKSAHGFLGKTERGSLLTMGIPVALTAFGGLVSGGLDPYGLHTIASSVFIGAVASYSDYRKAKSTSQNPYGASYLVCLDREFHNTGYYPAFDRYMEEFIND